EPGARELRGPPVLGEVLEEAPAYLEVRDLRRDPVQIVLRLADGAAGRVVVTERVERLRADEQEGGGPGDGQLAGRSPSPGSPSRAGKPRPPIRARARAHAAPHRAPRRAWPSPAASASPRRARARCARSGRGCARARRNGGWPVRAALTSPAPRPPR